MKKIVGILGVALLAVTLSLNSNSINSTSVNFDIANLISINTANAKVLATTCSASATCFYGSQAQGSVSCTGTNTCQSGFEYVICDGKRSECV